MRNYPDFIKAFLEYTQYIEAPEKYLHWSAISVIAGALERKVWINFKGQMDCYPNMYVILVGPPGLVKKSTSSKKAFELLSPLENLSFLSTQFTDAALILQMQRSGQRKVTIKDQEYSNSSVYVYASEAVNTLRSQQQGSGGNSIIQLLTDFYDCGKSRWSTDVGWSKETRGDGRINIYNPCVNLLGCSVPDWLVKSIGKEDLKSGFASRCLFIVHTDLPDRDFNWGEDIPDLSHMEEKLTEDLAEIAGLTGSFEIKRSFKDAWDDFDRKHKQHLLANKDDQMYGYLARKPWHLLKLSQILKVSKGNDLVLEGKDWDCALETIEKIEEPMYGAFGAVDMSPETHDLFEIWKDLKGETRPLSKAQILSRFVRKDSKIVMNCLMRLKDMGKISVNSIPGGITYQVTDSTELS